MEEPQAPPTVADGQALYQRRAWNQAYHALQLAGRSHPLSPEDLTLLSHSAHLSGREPERFDLLIRAHQAFLEAGQREAASRCAIWLAFLLEFQGQSAQSNGWLARAKRLLEEHGQECVELGYLELPMAIRAFFGGDATAAYSHFSHAAETANRFGDVELAVLARHGQGRALIRLNRVAEGVALLDEVMVAVTTDEVSPVIAGELYCSVLEACHEMYDLRRAQEWTLALARWCDSQPELVAFRGSCHARRSEILLLHGEWLEAESAAREACANQPDRAAALAWYQLGEVYRQQGEMAEAERAYHEAGTRGLQPEPGLALLRLAQGRVGQAGQSIRRALTAAHGPRARSALLSAAVEIALAEPDLSAAEQWAAELGGIAEESGARYLEAAAAQARGMVLGAQDRCSEALAELRHARGLWRELGMPYHAARVAVLVAQGCQKEGDTDAAAIELQSARRAFADLGAHHDLTRLAAQVAPATAAGGGLTARELEVLTMLAGGHTNRAISERLGISEKTVARHVSNIFSKLNLSSRSAATAYAYQHRLISTTT
ncbi:MAG TPA: LuxR C-terminal-related transcriptional regulator [Gemmatimonadales bacterium]|nr:LuxR C-terminal-related transcriptional regulator [Gemmatimonadales bacterium]